MIMPLLNVFGGLAVFIFGMKMMSDGLHQIAGEKMRAILKLFSANQLIAILSGTAVTAVIQSSSASTVMVIGFVNAGLLSLTQAIGIIFGANIGTTVTAQLVAFDIAWIIMPAIILGVLLGFANRGNLAHWGTTLAGFGFLFLGMEFMADELQILAEKSWFMAAFQSFDCTPIGGTIPFGALLGAIGVGLAATAIIQSSSACAGIIIALGASGVINLYTAVALVLGSNIGTTVTALLAAIPANRIARQAALAHTLFNVIGVILCVLSFLVTTAQGPIFFQFINYLSPGGDLPRQIANAHTVFNVATTLVLTPFIPVLARICEKVIPIRPEGVRFIRLEPHLLETPALALNQSISALCKLLRNNYKMIDYAFKLRGDQEKRQKSLLRLIERDTERNAARRREIANYLALLMQRPLSAHQAEQIPALLRGVDAVEVLGHYAPQLAGLMEKLRESGAWDNSGIPRELEALENLLNQQQVALVAALTQFNPEAELNCQLLPEKLASRLNWCERAHLKRLKNQEIPAESGVIYLELLMEIRKISQQLADLAHYTGAVQGRSGKREARS